MCGDLEEEDTAAIRLYGAFLHNAHSMVHDIVDHRGGSRAALGSSEGDGGQEEAVSEEALHKYMDGLFCDVLGACIKDGQRISEGERYRLLAAQAVVVSRLAGFLASQLDPAEDPLRNAIGALMYGYDADEPEHHHHGHEH